MIRKLRMRKSNSIAKITNKLKETLKLILLKQIMIQLISLISTIIRKVTM